MASSNWQQSIRGLVWFHRWASIVMCLLFAMWFASGALMLFVPFPSLPQSERLTHSDSIDFSRVSVAPAAALSLAPQTQGLNKTLKLVSNAGQPVYVVGGDSQITAVINASNGTLRAPLDANAARDIAEHFGGTRVAQVEANVAYDQWVVHQGFDAGRPYYRVSLNDAAGSVLYVSARSGEVVQRTTHRQRLLNMGGAVLHWIYFTPVRQHWSFWDQLVWWISLAALLGAMTGMFLGIYRFIQARRLDRPGLGMFRGWLRWHHMLGLFAGTFLLCWIFSGWLSMDHGRLFSRGGATEQEVARFQGRSLTQIAGDISLNWLQSLHGTGMTELRFNALGGQSFVLVQNNTGMAQVHLANQASALSMLPDALLDKAAAATWSDAQPIKLSRANPQDVYARAEEVSDDARMLSLSGSHPRQIYVDTRSGEINAVVDSSRRAYAWLYYMLHTYKFPRLVNHDWLRIGGMLVALLAGFSLSVTGVVLSYKHLARTSR